MGLSNYVPSSRVSQAGVCTSTTRPASPYEGQMIYETDTDEIRVWTGASWLSIPAYTFSKVSGDATISSTGTITIADATYTNASYTAGWENYFTTWGPAQYAKTSTGVVNLIGLSKRTSGSSAVIFNLPAGFRPSTNLVFSVAGSGGVARVDVYPNGNVEVISSLAGTVNVADWIAINGITFIATQ